MEFLLIAVASSMDIVILGVQNLSFGKPGASLEHPGGYFGSVGTAWGTMGAAGRTCGGPEQNNGKHPLE